MSVTSADSISSEGVRRFDLDLDQPSTPPGDNPIIVWDPVNRALCRHFRRTEAQLVDMGVVRLVGPGIPAVQRGISRS